MLRCSLRSRRREALIQLQGNQCLSSSRADWIWADLNDEGFVEIVSKAVAGKLGGTDILY